MFDIIVRILPIIVIVLIVAVIFLLGYVKAPPDQAYIISGLKKESKVLIGRAGIRVPFLTVATVTSSTSTWTPWPRSASPLTRRVLNWRLRTS